MRRNLLSFLFRKMLMSTFFLRFKSNYLEKMRCYPNFSSWILTTLAKIYFSAWSKPGANCLVFSWHRPCVTLDHSIFVTQLCANLKGTDKTKLLLVFGCIWLSGTQPDTCTNALASINILQLEDTWKTMAYRSPI